LLLQLNWVWSCVVANEVVVIFVKQVVMRVAQVLGTTLAELGSALGATGLSFHSFLARDSKATNVSYFDFFAGLEIGGHVWG
jgi:hypothetical protein